MIVSKQNEFGALPAEGFVRQKQLLKSIPFSAATLWRAVKKGSFPAPVRLSERITAWSVESVREWLVNHGPDGTT